MKRKTFLKYSLLSTGLTAFTGSKVFGFVYSKAKRLFTNPVQFILCGGVHNSSVKINAKLTSPTNAARLVVSNDISLNNPVYSGFEAANATTNQIVHLQITGLQPNTKYYYGIESDGVIDVSPDAIGSFKTSKTGPFSFKFTVGSCMGNGYHPVFNKIAEKEPILTIIHGDFHYSDPNSATDIEVHRAPLERRLKQPGLKNLLGNCALAYTWDDHDFSGDNSNTWSPGKTNARLVYQEFFPHYPLAAGNGDVPIYHSFIIGRIRFIMSDLRSERDNLSMMGSTQKQWFKNECQYAQSLNQAIVWISSVPWGGTSGDSWLAFGAERTELSDFFKASAIKHLFIICGDSHMIAIDNGNSHDFSTGGNNPHRYPVLQAGALNGVGSNKGGQFSENAFLNPDPMHGQYALIDITDNGGQIDLSINGYRVTHGGVETSVVNYNFSFAMQAALPIIISAFSVTPITQGKALVTWKVEDQSGCKRYIVERGKNNRDFQPVGFINCTSFVQPGTHYQFIDELPLEGISYYRLKAVEQDDSFSYSIIKRIQFQKTSSVEIVTNPIQSHLNLRIESFARETTNYSILDSSSRVLMKNTIKLNKGLNQIAIPTHRLRAGNYLFIVTVNDIRFANQFIKQ